MTASGFLKIAAFSGLALTGASSVTASETLGPHLLSCHGGEGMYIAAGANLTEEPSIAIGFIRSAHGASEMPPAPGSCAWSHRRHRLEDPEIILYREPGGIDTTTQCSVDGCEILSTSETAQKLLDAVRYGEPFKLVVYDNGEGLLMAAELVE